jgi:hypothetical protein
VLSDDVNVCSDGPHQNEVASAFTYVVPFSLADVAVTFVAPFVTAAKDTKFAVIVAVAAGIVNVVSVRAALPKVPLLDVVQLTNWYPGFAVAVIGTSVSAAYEAAPVVAPPPIGLLLIVSA